jgi:hypothetical protein
MGSRITERTEHRNQNMRAYQIEGTAYDVRSASFKVCDGKTEWRIAASATLAIKENDHVVVTIAFGEVPGTKSDGEYRDSFASRQHLQPLPPEPDQADFWKK